MHKYIVLVIIITLKGYINKRPKNKTIPNNKKIVMLLGTIIFFNEYVGNLLIKRNEVVINKIGTNNS